MMEALKFRAWDFKVMSTMPLNTNYGLSRFFGILSNNAKIMQYTGLKDQHSKEIYEGDLLNIFFTSSDKGHIHDCIFRAEIGVFGDLQFAFVKLLWESFGHNQYPISQTLNIGYRSLDVFFIDDVETLIVPDTYNKNHLTGQIWKGLDKSAYFEIIGNIHENPELLKETT